MTLAQKYRVEFAAQNGDRLLLYAAIAVVLHLFGLVAGLTLLRLILPTAWIEPPPEDVVAIEFVYLDDPELEVPPPETATVEAAVNSRDQGAVEESNPTVINEGQATSLVSAKPDDAALDPTPSTDKAIASAPRSASTQTIAAPTATTTPDQTKAIAPPLDAPKSRSPVPVVPTLPNPDPVPVTPPASAPSSSTTIKPDGNTPNPELDPSGELPVLPGNPTVTPPSTPNLAANSSNSTTATEPALPTDWEFSTLPEREVDAATPLESGDAAPVTDDAAASPADTATDTTAAAAPSDRGQGLAGTATPTTATEDAELQLAAQQAELGRYQQTVEARLNEHWDDVPVETRQQAIVRFTVARSGELLAVELREAAAQANVNQAAIAAVESAAPFDPLPNSYASDRLVINYTFISDVATPDFVPAGE